MLKTPNLNRKRVETKLGRIGSWIRFFINSIQTFQLGSYNLHQQQQQQPQKLPRRKVGWAKEMCCYLVSWDSFGCKQRKGGHDV